jgi:hypothetical protein
MNAEVNIVRQPNVADGTYRRRRLHVMQHIALGLLLAAGLFAIGRSQHGQHFTWDYLESASKASSAHQPLLSK